MRKLSILILSVVFALPLLAQPRLLTVDELFSMGIDNSLKVKSSQMGVDIATDVEGSAKANRLPNVAIDVVNGYLSDVTVFTGSGLTGAVNKDIPGWLQKYDVTLTQSLFRGGKIQYSVDKAALQTEIAKLNVVRDKAEVKLLLITKYLDLFRLYKEKIVLEENIKDAQQRLRDIRNMKKEGMITSNDVIRSEIQLTQYELALRESNDNVAIVSQQLDVVLGLNENIILVPDTTALNVAYRLQSYDDYVVQAYHNFPELKMAEVGTLLAEKNLKIARADYMPSLFFRATNNLDRPILTSTPVQDYFTNSWTASLVLSYNLSSLYQNRSVVSANKKAIQLQETQEEQLKQNIRTSIKAAYIKYQESLDRVSVLAKSVTQAEENYRIVNHRYLNQLSTLTDLLDASGVRLSAELQLTLAKSNVVNSYYQLLRVSGDL